MRRCVWSIVAAARVDSLITPPRPFRSPSPSPLSVLFHPWPVVVVLSSPSSPALARCRPTKRVKRYQRFRTRAANRLLWMPRRGEGSLSRGFHAIRHPRPTFRSSTFVPPAPPPPPPIFSLAAWEGPAITLLPLFTTRSKTHERASACRASEFFAFYRFIIKAGPLHRLPISGDRDATLATQSNHAVLLECTNLFSDPLSPFPPRRAVLFLSPPTSFSPFLLSSIVRLEFAWYRRGSRFCHFSTNPSRFHKISFAIRPIRSWF